MYGKNDPEVMSQEALRLTQANRKAIKSAVQEVILAGALMGVQQRLKFFAELGPTDTHLTVVQAMSQMHPGQVKFMAQLALILLQELTIEIANEVNAESN